MNHFSVARESVQNALFTHLLTRFSHNEATARFGHLLLLIASATVGITKILNHYICENEILQILVNAKTNFTE